MNADLKRLTRIQTDVLKTVLVETMRHNCPPSATHLKEVMGRDVRGPLDQLEKAGYLKQPFPRGPYVPTKDTDGNSLRLTVLPEDLARDAESEAYRRK